MPNAESGSHTALKVRVSKHPTLNTDQTKRYEQLGVLKMIFPFILKLFQNYQSGLNLDSIRFDVKVSDTVV